MSQLPGLLEPCSFPGECPKLDTLEPTGTQECQLTRPSPGATAGGEGRSGSSQSSKGAGAAVTCIVRPSTTEHAHTEKTPPGSSACRGCEAVGQATSKRRPGLLSHGPLLQADGRVLNGSMQEVSPGQPAGSTEESKEV